jgi:hypothetical protein
MRAALVILFLLGLSGSPALGCGRVCYRAPAVVVQKGVVVAAPIVAAFVPVVPVVPAYGVGYAAPVAPLSQPAAPAGTSGAPAQAASTQGGEDRDRALLEALAAITRRLEALEAGQGARPAEKKQEEKVPPAMPKADEKK